MAAPTQAYPPWLSPEPITTTQDGTVVVQTTVVQFPQTYYGPSIPLGPGWVFGGSTFPASIATSFAAPSAPSISAVSSLPSQTIATSASTTATSASATATSMSTLTAGSSITASSSAPSSSTSALSSPNISHGVSSGTQLAIILSTILGTVLLGVLVLVLCRIHLRQRRRRVLLGEGNFSDWSFVPPVPQQQQHTEGTPGESERAVLLTGERRMRERRAGPTVFPAWPTSPPEPSQVDKPTTMAAVRTITTSLGSASKADSSTLDSAEKREDLARFNASGSGSLFFNPGREGGRMRRSDATEEDAALAAGVATAFGSTTNGHSVQPSGAGPTHVPARSSARPTRASTPTSPTALYLRRSSPSSPRDGERLYRNDVHRFGAIRARESQEDAEEELLPPRRIDPDRVSRSDNNRGSRGSLVYPDSPQSETDERATLLTARRVNIGPASQPVLASSPPERRKSLEGWVTPPHEGDAPTTKPPPSPGSWSVGLGGLTGLARGLGRLSWFRRMDNEPGPSGTHHSSPSPSHRGRGSRPASGVSFALPASRPHSGLFHPPFASRPSSGVSYRLVDTELGIRPPGIRDTGTASGSGGSGSGKSGGTAYHSVSSLPRTSFYVSGSEHAYPEGEPAHTTPTTPALPPDFDLGDTIRSVDVLDLPVPERALPFSAPVLPEPSSSRSRRPDTGSSRGTGLPFPPGLVTVQKWDKSSHSGSSNRGGTRDMLEDEPPQAGGEWSSLRSKGSASDLGHVGSEDIGGRRGLMTSSSTREQAVRVVVGEPTASETASISSAPRHPADPGPPATATSPRSPTGLFVLTPRVSMYAASQSDLFSHSGSGSHSSRPSQHATLHSQEASQPSSSNHENDYGNPPPPPGSAFHRASLTAMGDQRPPQLPPLRPLSHMQPMMEQPSEDRETEEESGTATISRPGTAVSQPTLSEATNTGTFSSGTTSTGARTTVPSTVSSPGKR